MAHEWWGYWDCIYPSFVYVSLKEFGVVGSDTYTWGIKDFHKCWSGSLAKRRLCLGPSGVINCTPLSALSFWVSLFPGTCGYSSFFSLLKSVIFLSWLQGQYLFLPPVSLRFPSVIFFLSRFLPISLTSLSPSPLPWSQSTIPYLCNSYSSFNSQNKCYFLREIFFDSP